MISYVTTDLDQLRVRIDLLCIIDDNGILKNQIDEDAVNQIFFTLQLMSHGRIQTPKKYTKITTKQLIEQSILFQWNYSDLCPDDMIGISIWSSAKLYDEKKPLGSTTISLFNQHKQLRQGKYHLYIWPDTLSDFSNPSSTSGLTKDPNVQTINFISDRLQEKEKADKNSSQQIMYRKTEQALKLKLTYTYRMIPAAFLQIQLPSFSASVFYKDKICSDYEEKVFVESANRLDFDDRFNIYDLDFQANRLDPLQQTFFVLRRQHNTNPQQLQPDQEQMKIINHCVKKSFKIDLKTQERQLFVKYRYYLSQQSNSYLLHFLHSVRWDNNDQEKQALKLLKMWQKISQDDALHILSRQFPANSLYNKKKYHPALKAVRQYAVEIIAESKNEDLIPILLQLVQSIKYDSIDSALVKFLVQRSLQNEQMATLFFWYLKTETDEVKVDKQSSSKVKENATQSTIRMYQKVFYQFLTVLSERKPQIKTSIKQQQSFLQLLRKISNKVRQNKENISKKKQQLKKQLMDVNWQSFGITAFPMDVQIKLKWPIPQQCSIFSSAMAPFKLTFQTIDGKKYTFIYKNGDDLRQDQLVLGVFGLMDKLLKGINQDYKLTPYKTLACSKTDGYVEFVPQTITLQAINVKQYLSNIILKNQKYHTGVNVMENYIFSSAGYCSITYFFGIGDRHLQNLLIDSSGKLFHIDFGFILGRDPKPYPPPIKICKEMIQGMGGSQSQAYKKFKLKCIQAYIYLRKYAKLIYNLFYLMMDSGIKDVHSEGMLKLYDKFLITMNDKQAQKHFTMVLEQCQNALFGRLADTIHRWASYFRQKV